MPSLKPIDHQNIVLRLLARSASCDAQHLTALAHAHKLPAVPLLESYYVTGGATHAAE